LKDYQTGQIRNLGVVAHGGAGKTSLVEAMLFNTGVLSRLGRVEDGTTTSDYHPEEIARQTTIHTSLVPCEWNNTKINLLDTPGFSDFIGEVKGALRVADSAMFVVSSVDGVEVQHEIIWDIADQYKLPRLVFINKMDRENANFEKVLDDLMSNFKANFVPFQIPIGAFNTFTGVIDTINEQAYTGEGKGKETAIPEDLTDKIAEYREQLIEAAADGDDDLTIKYLEGEELTPEEIREGLKKSIILGKVIPVLAGSATKNIGIAQLLNVIENYLPAPEENDGPVTALVFKTIADPYVGKMNYLRVFNGNFKSDSVYFNSAKEKNEKVGNVLYIRGKNTVQTNNVPTGDMAVVVKLQETGTGDTLCAKENPVVLEGIEFPIPTLTVAIEPKSKNDEDKLGDAISKILEEEPSMRVEKNTETKQTLLTGMGELHLNIIIDKLKRKYGVAVVTADPKVPYRETIKSKVEVEGKHKKQSGGRGQYGHVWIRFEPNPDGDFVFEEDIFGGSVPKQYFPAVEKGLREAMTEGVLAGYPATGIKATLYDGSYHTVDSSEMAFKIAASLAFKKGVQQANPTLLEPIMNVETVVPENFMGDIISDFNTRRGRVLGTESKDRQTVIKAMVPLAEMYRYTIDLKAMTQGRGLFSMEFSSYEEVPSRQAEEIVKKAKAAAQT